MEDKCSHLFGSHKLIWASWINIKTMADCLNRFRDLIMSPTRGKGPRDLWRSSLKKHIMGAFQIARDALTPAACQKLYPWVLWKGPVLLVSKTSQWSNWERRILLCWGRFSEIKKEMLFTVSVCPQVLSCTKPRISIEKYKLLQEALKL